MQISAYLIIRFI